MKHRTLESAIPRFLADPGIESPVVMADLSDHDHEVLSAVREGDTEAFGKLVYRYESFVYTLVLGIVRSDEAAKDIAQETFLRAYRGIRRFELRSSFKTWLYRIAHNTSMSHLKREGLNGICDERKDEEPAIDSAGNHYLRLTLEKLIGKLKPEHRSVIIFHYYDDLKYEEIAEILDCPIGTVKIRLYRAKHELKKLWAKYAV